MPALLAFVLFAFEWKPPLEPVALRAPPPLAVRSLVDEEFWLVPDCPLPFPSPGLCAAHIDLSSAAEKIIAISFFTGLPSFFVNGLIGCAQN